MLQTLIKMENLFHNVIMGEGSVVDECQLSAMDNAQP